jgi:hypothetical protein
LDKPQKTCILKVTPRKSPRPEGKTSPTCNIIFTHHCHKTTMDYILDKMFLLKRLGSSTHAHYNGLKVINKFKQNMYTWETSFTTLKCSLCIVFSMARILIFSIIEGRRLKLVRATNKSTCNPLRLAWHSSHASAAEVAAAQETLESRIDDKNSSRTAP